MIKKTLREKRGSTMVEAAIIFPLILLSVMAMIYLLINIYSTVSLQSHMHLLLREESSKKSGMVKYEIEDDYKRDKIRRKAESVKIGMVEKNNAFSKYLEAQRESTYTVNMMINTSPKVKSYGRSFVYNQSNIVRLKSVVIKD